MDVLGECYTWQCSILLSSVLPFSVEHREPCDNGDDTQSLLHNDYVLSLEISIFSLFLSLRQAIRITSTHMWYQDILMASCSPWHLQLSHLWSFSLGLPTSRWSGWLPCLLVASNVEPLALYLLGNDSNLWIISLALIWRLDWGPCHGENLFSSSSYTVFHSTQFPGIKYMSC